MLIRLSKAAIQKTLKRFGREIRHVEKPVPEDPKFAWLGKLGIKTVLDIGANVGEFSQMMTRILPGCQIYAFEPLEECVVVLRNNLAGYPQFQVFNTALGNYSGGASMRRNALTYASSLLENTELHLQNYPELKQSSHAVSVSVSALDQMAEEMRLEPALLIKIDVEGYTKQVIEGGSRTLDRAHAVIIEASYWPLYQGQVLFDWVYDAMRQKGFRYAGNVKQQLSPVDGSVLQADAVFVNETAYRRLRE
jgi:FkbM family methyltransferase